MKKYRDYLNQPIGAEESTFACRTCGDTERTGLDDGTHRCEPCQEAVQQLLQGEINAK